MADQVQTVEFSDGEAYEKFMGRWSRAAGRQFLSWLDLSAGLRWLDVGCGTGVFAETIHEVCGAKEIVGVDPAEAQIAYAQSRNTGETISYEVADARSIPYEDNSFDVAAAALVINFIPDREKAVAEMQRVVKPGGMVSAYVWDFAGGSGIAQHLRVAIAQYKAETNQHGNDALNVESTRRESLEKLFGSAGIANIVSSQIEIDLQFRDFDDYWTSNTKFASPAGKFIKSLNDDELRRFQAILREKLTFGYDGVISYSSRVNAVKGQA